MVAADASRALMSFERPAGASGAAPRTPARPAVPAKAQKVHAAGVSLAACLAHRHTNGNIILKPVFLISGCVAYAQMSRSWFQTYQHHRCAPIIAQDSSSAHRPT